MRTMIVAFGLFIYVASDITVNHGASLRVWISLLSSLIHSIGL